MHKHKGLSTQGLLSEIEQWTQVGTPLQALSPISNPSAQVSFLLQRRPPRPFGVILLSRTSWRESLVGSDCVPEQASKWEHRRLWVGAAGDTTWAAVAKSVSGSLQSIPDCAGHITG